MWGLNKSLQLQFSLRIRSLPIYQHFKDGWYKTKILAMYKNYLQQLKILTNFSSMKIFTKETNLFQEESESQDLNAFPIANWHRVQILRMRESTTVRKVVAMWLAELGAPVVVVVGIWRNVKFYKTLSEIIKTCLKKVSVSISIMWPFLLLLPINKSKVIFEIFYLTNVVLVGFLSSLFEGTEKEFFLF